MADKNLMKSLILILLLLGASELLFAYASQFMIPAIVAIFIWGFFAFATVPGLQIRIVNQAVGAPNLASTFNIAFFNIGNGLGAIVGSIIITSGFSLVTLPIFASVFAFIATALAIISTKMKAKNN
jgi:DHA1 family inner membrane transport protein